MRKLSHWNNKPSEQTKSEVIILRLLPLINYRPRNSYNRREAKIMILWQASLHITQTCLSILVFFIFAMDKLVYFISMAKSDSSSTLKQLLPLVVLQPYSQGSTYVKLFSKSQPRQFTPRTWGFFENFQADRICHSSVNHIKITNFNQS